MKSSLLANYYNPESLLDICARSVAETIPFQRIEERYERIPEPVQRRIIFYSFPRYERDVCMYSSFQGGDPASSSGGQFARGVKLIESGSVKDVLQVGFHLSGTVATGTSNEKPANGEHAGNGETKIVVAPMKVSVTFDRCKITSISCSCGQRDIFWCEHVVALVLFRIRNAEIVKLRVPISETLLQMDRQQLQKLLQYLISEHTDVLPTAQHLADDIILSSSDINRIAGAPDPTAGAAADDDHSWALDEEQICEQVKSFLNQGAMIGIGNNNSQSNFFNQANKSLLLLFAKVREMLKARDSNGPRMLTLITEQFLNDPRLVQWKVQGTPMTDKHRQLWDQLGTLWVCVVLNPRSLLEEKSQWRNLLRKFASSSVCPWEDPDFQPQSTSTSSSYHSQGHRSSSDESSDNEGSRRSHHHHHHYHHDSRKSKRPKLSKKRSGSKRPRTVFHRALDSLSVTWDEPWLQSILAGDGEEPSTSRDDVHVLPETSSSYHRKCNERELGEPPDYAKTMELTTRQEKLVSNLSVSCSRVDALRSHGYVQESLRLAVAIVRAMKRKQMVDQLTWGNKSKQKSIPTTSSGVARISKGELTSRDGLLGHALDPICVLFDTLTEACIIKDDDEEEEKPAKYTHIPVPGSCGEKSESLLTLAMEAALIGLGQQRIMPNGLYAQEKVCRMEERLIQKLQEVEQSVVGTGIGTGRDIKDPLLVRVMKNQARIQLDSGPASGLGIGIHPGSIPMHTYARYLFLTLLPIEAELAYAVGLRAMRLPFLDELEEDDYASQTLARRYSRWYTLGHIEVQQCTLASTMLNASKSDLTLLQTVLDSAQSNIHSSSHLFRLAQDAFRLATPQDAPRHHALLNVAFKLGLQVMRMTLNTLHRRRWEMVRWLVTCATEVGIDSLVYLLQNWSTLFTPTEAAGSVATNIMSRTTAVRLNLGFSQQEELSTAARNLALQCARKDPPNCALNALTLCENEPIAFETAYQIVIDSAATHIMNSQQLFTIARYMEHRGYPLRAYKLALLAMENVHIAFNQDSHPAISDIHWACSLSHSLGRNELSGMIPVLVKNVQCATVLSEILRRCTLTQPGSAANATTLGHHPPSPKRSRSSTSANQKPLTYTHPPLKLLVDAGITAYINTTHSRLTHISPRHYTDFIEFLSKAKETFTLAPDGLIQFGQLIDNMKITYKGKKKLMFLVKERFG